MLYFFFLYTFAAVNAMPPVQVILQEPHPRQFAEVVLEDGVIGGILNLDIDPPVPDEQM